MVGQTVWLIIGLIVIAVQISRFNDPERSKCAMLSLIFFWVSAMTAGINGIFKDSIQAESPWLFMLIALLAFLFLIASITLAIIGLVQTFGPISRRKRGRSPAIWSLCLSLILLNMAGYGFYKGFSQRQQAIRAIEAKSPAGHRQSGNYLYENEEFNYRFELPGRGWAELDAEKLNPELSFAAMNRKRKAFVMVVAEHLGQIDFDMAAMEEVVRANITSAYASSTSTDYQDATVGGHDVRLMEVDALLGTNHLEYQFHLFFKHGVFYQVVVYYSGVGNREKSADYTEEIMRGFSLIDDNFATTLDAQYADKEMEAPNLGLNIPLQGNQWLHWDSLKTDAPYLDDGSLIAGNAAMGIAGSLEYDEDEDIESVIYGLSRILEIDLSEIPGVQRETATLDDHDATDILFSDLRDGGVYQFRMRVAYEKGVAVAIIGWWHEDLDEPASILATMDSAAFDPSQAGKPERYTPVERTTQGNIMNGSGLFHYERSRYQHAMDCFMRASELDDSDPVYLQNVLVAANEAGLYDAGIAFAESRIDRHKDYPGLQADYGMTLAYAGKIKESMPYVVDAYAGGYQDDSTLFDYLVYLSDQELYAEAIDTLIPIIEAKPTDKRKAWLSSFYRMNDQPGEAAKLLADYSIKKGTHSTVLEELILIKLDQGLDTEAVELADQWLAFNPAAYDALLRKIDALVNLGWMNEAKETLAIALESYPDDEEVQSYKQWVEAEMGQDDTSLVSKPIEPVAVPPSISELMAGSRQADLPEGWEDFTAAYDYKVRGYAFEPGEPVRATINYRVRIHSRQGVEEFSTLDFTFDQSAESFYLNKLDVYNEAGELVSSVQREAMYLADESDTDMATDDMTLYVPVSGLAPGYTMAWQATWLDKAASETFPYTQRYWASSYPCQAYVTYVEGAVDEVAVVTERVDKLDVPEADIMAWHLREVPRVYFESSMPDYATVFPVIVLGSQAMNWEDVARDYLEDIDAYLQPDDDIAAIVAGQDLEGKTLQEKVEHLAHLAQDRVVYKALEFGSRGRIPYAAGKTWEQRYGDCKDQTILMYQLLKHAGIASHPMLINTYTQLVEPLPSMDQFDHMVLYIPALEPHPVIDLVDTEYDFSYGPPGGLGGRLGLVCDPENPRLYRVPDYPYAPSEPVASVTCEIAPGDDNTLEINETLELTGYYGTWLKRHYQGIDPGRRPAEVKDSLAYYLPDEAEITRAEVRKLGRDAWPFTIEVAYTLPMGDDPLTLQPAWENYYLEMTASSERHQPYRLRYPFALESILVYDPAVFRVAQQDAAYRPGTGMVHHQQSVKDIKATDHTAAKRADQVRIGWPSQVMDAREYHDFHRQLNQSRAAAKRSVNRVAAAQPKEPE